MVYEGGLGAIHMTRIVRPAMPDEFAHYMAYMTQVLGLGHTFAIVVDASIEGSALTPSNLRAIASWVASHRAALRAQRVGYALIRDRIPPPVRFATAMLLSLMPVTPMPYRMFGGRESALNWVEKLLAGRANADDLNSKAWSEPPPE